VLGSRYCVYQQHQPSFGQELHCMACNTAKKTKAPAHNTLSKQPATASQQRMRQGVAVPAAWHTSTALQSATAEHGTHALHCRLQQQSLCCGSSCWSTTTGGWQFKGLPSQPHTQLLSLDPRRGTTRAMGAAQRTAAPDEALNAAPGITRDLSAAAIGCRRATAGHKAAAETPIKNLTPRLLQMGQC
jgi:hypothetical protein